MLLLRRKKGQDIYITVPGRDKPIRLTVTRFIDSPTYGLEVELGFDCEDDIDVLRHEIYEEDDTRGNR